MVIALSGIGLSSQVVGAGKPLQSISMLAEDGGPYYEQITRGAESVAKAIDSAVPISLPLAVAAELPLPKAPVGSAAEHFAAIEARSGGRLGVAALDIGSGKRIDYRANERFAMCSTFKAVLAAAVLKRVDEHEQRLSDLVEYNETDLLDYAPVTKEHVKEGGMTVDALCAAAVEYSDNTAANLLLRTIGGPAALTRYLRSVGDRASRLDRIEPDLNTAIAGDERDTTTPAAMLENLRVLLLADALSAESLGILEGWLMQSKTGAATIRAGLPSTWRVGTRLGGVITARRTTSRLFDRQTERLF